MPKACDDFTRSFIDTLIWTNELEDQDPFILDLDSIKVMAEDCKDFQKSNAADLELYYSNGYGASDAGYDFALTRNGHGTGFWDRGLDDLGRRLSDASKVYGSIDLYIGDDGIVYV